MLFCQGSCAAVSCAGRSSTLPSTAGELDDRVHERGTAILPPGDADLLDDRLDDLHLGDVVDAVVLELLGRQERKTESSLHHVEPDGGIFGVADDVRLKAGVPAGVAAELKGNLAGLVEDEALVFQLPQADVFPSGKRMRFRNGQRVAVLAEFVELQRRGQTRDRAVHESDVERVLVELLDEVVGAALDNVHVDAGVAREKGREHPAEVDALQARDDPDVELALAQPGEAVHLRLQSAHALQDLLGAQDEFLSRLRECDGVRVAHEQRYAQFLFQLGDLLRQGWLADVAGLRGQREFPVLRHRQYILQRKKFHGLHFPCDLRQSPLPLFSSSIIESGAPVKPLFLSLV